jgi:phosphoglycerol transferase MdoB-like AlkP superfamily enzyme
MEHKHIFHITQLIKRLSIVLLLYSICRLWFLLMNYSHFSNVDSWVFIAGIRFDMVAIGYTNLLFIFLSLIPFTFRENSIYQSVLKSIYFVFNGLALAANCIDLVYFGYTLKRTTADIFRIKGMQQDIFNLLPQFITDYWYVPILWILLLWMGIYLYKKTEKPLPSYLGKKLKYFFIHFIFMIVFGGLFLISIRGGLQDKPIGIITASRHTDIHNVPLVLNTPFTILKSLESDNLELKNYFDDDVALSHYNPVKFYQPKGKFSKTNVVIIIMESFSLEYTALGSETTYTPFLDSLANEGLTFSNAYANGKRSVEGIPSILASLPTLMSSPFISSPYSGNKISSIASLLKTKGYHSSFFHGGNNGTMGFDDFTALAGFSQYAGRNEYEAENQNNGKDYDGLWGIWDHKFFEFYADKLNTLPQPFVSSVFSLSSHHPFTVPEKYSELKPGSQEIHRSIRYADIALRNFFDKIKDKDWFEKTLFIITADHTGPQNNPNTATLTDRYRIPLIFFHSGTDLKGIENKVVQQIDILPSVLDYLNYDEPFFSFGESVFNKNYEGYAINFGNDQYQFINQKYNLTFNGIENTKIIKHSANIEDYTPLEKMQMELKLKSIVQVYNRMMIENKQQVQWIEKR